MPGKSPVVRLFLDETMIRSDGVQERNWFAVVGCLMSLEEHGRRLHGPFDDIKGRRFRHHSPRAPVIFHRIDMCCPSPRGAFSVLRDEALRESLYQELLGVIDACDFKVIVEVVEIRELSEREKSDWRTLGYLKCLGPLLMKYCQELIESDQRGDVMASHLGMKEDGILKTAYWVLYQRGGHGKYASFYRRGLSSNSLKIEHKEKNVAGLQLADLLAAPMVRRYLYERTGANDNVDGFARRVAEIGSRKRV